MTYLVRMIPLVMRLRVHDLGQYCCLQSPLSWNDLQNLVNENIFLVAFNNKIVVQETLLLEQIYLIHVQHQRHTTWGQHLAILMEPELRRLSTKHV